MIQHLPALAVAHVELINYRIAASTVEKVLEDLDSAVDRIKAREKVHMKLLTHRDDCLDSIHCWGPGSASLRAATAKYRVAADAIAALHRGDAQSPSQCRECGKAFPCTTWGLAHTLMTGN